MATERKSFVFHAEWAHGIRKLSKDLRADIYDAIVEYGLSGTVPSGLKPVAEAVLTMVRARMDAERERYEAICAARRDAGRRGGQARASKSSNCQQVQANLSGAKQVQHDTDTDTDTVLRVKERREREKALSTSPFFEAWWDAYPDTPRKTAAARELAAAQWRDQELDGHSEQVMDALDAWRKSSQWQDVQFVPAPNNWLARRQWDVDADKMREAASRASSPRERRLSARGRNDIDERIKGLLCLRREFGVLSREQEDELEALRARRRRDDEAATNP